MLTRRTNMLFVLFAGLMMPLSTSLLASELTKLIVKEPDKLAPLTNDNADSLPTQYATDHQGNVIVIPTEQSSALEYRADDIYLKPSRKKLITTQSNAGSSISKRSNTMSITTITNDPNCRWLNNRIKNLKKKQRQTQNSQFSHYQDEIDIRQKEWTCLKCATSGPNNVDRGECQHKR
ncbi:hypothetical protein H5202_14140 [Shewanella sp. SG41-4]|uniref:hypothetical protein n=1 Tax=Shewanella sp. SG41-4 TaxID=2760976 RepID=UPI0016006F1D|nr:hypothetical protein [Shewanella sp. SG41-4]MBB1439791.1 hypothetical protein [Shewanella sp. SG41-4]